MLLVAYRKQVPAGYLGILPDDIQIAGSACKTGSACKIGWLTGWWVDPAHTSSGIGTVLLFRALNAYRNRIGVSGSSKAATKVLEASRKFVAIPPLEGMEITLDGRFSDVKDGAPTDFLDFEYVSAIDAQTDALLQRHHRHDLARKDKAALDWVMTYPWVLTAPLKDAASRKFHFSSVAARFFYLGVKVLERDGGMAGFFMLKVRDDSVTLIFAYFGDEHARTVSAAVIRHASALQAKSLVVYERRIIAEFERIRFADRPTRAVSRGFFLTGPLADLPQAGYRLQGGDGDLAFY